MSVLVNALSPPVLVLATALGYALATVGMKCAADGLLPLGLTLAILGGIAAISFEIALLRRSDLSLVYIGIVVAETLLVLGYAAMIGEGLSPRQVGGALLVLAGLAAIGA